MVVSSRIELSVFWASSHASNCFLYSLRCSAMEPLSLSSVSNSSCWTINISYVSWCLLINHDWKKHYFEPEIISKLCEIIPEHMLYSSPSIKVMVAVIVSVPMSHFISKLWEIIPEPMLYSRLSIKVIVVVIVSVPRSYFISKPWEIINET